MNSTIVLKFGGSSVKDNESLKLVAEKIIELYKNSKNIVVVVSAQGKTTDKLIEEAESITKVPNSREMDVLLSTGEQITIAKLAILLESMGYNAISLTGWQAGIFTTDKSQNATIQNIDISRVKEELEKNKIVIVAGFQGINEKMDITTLGRGGSDTTAVALAAALKAEECLIFSDVDGVYTADPNIVKGAVKLNSVSYNEMLDMSDEGAKVLHNRCVEIGQKFNVPIVCKSTFNSNPGTTVSDKIEETLLKSIVKNDKILFVKVNESDAYMKVLNAVTKNGIDVNRFINCEESVAFTTKLDNEFKLKRVLENELGMNDVKYTNITKISLIGYGIKNNGFIVEKILDVIKLMNLNLLHFELTEAKLTLLFDRVIGDDVADNIHKCFYGI